jgi:hypothetical protein
MSSLSRIQYLRQHSPNAEVPEPIAGYSEGHALRTEVQGLQGIQLIINRRNGLKAHENLSGNDP